VPTNVSAENGSIKPGDLLAIHFLCTVPETKKATPLAGDFSRYRRTQATSPASSPLFTRA
jgi:hypothetical protein